MQLAFIPRIVAAAAAAAVLAAALPLDAQTVIGQTIIEEWNTVPVPTPPPLKRASLDPKTTALLMLDFMRQNCGPRPRCITSLPAVGKLLETARNARATVIYSIIANSTTADILAPVAPRAGEPNVQAGPNKFVGTNLDELLKQHGVKTVVVVGTAAQGAVLNTAAAAALAGYDVVVPVDGMSGEPYAEQYTTWHLANLPGAAQRVTLTRSDAIAFTR